MLQRLRLHLNNRVVAWAGVIGVGLLPCTDCGTPLAVHIWPVAGAIVLYRWWRQRGEAKLDLLINDDLQARTPSNADTLPDEQP